MWIYILLGNILRGIGETPVQPLGISYIDDHALEDNAAFYIGIKGTITISLLWYIGFIYAVKSDMGC